MLVLGRLASNTSGLRQGANEKGDQGVAPQRPDAHTKKQKQNKTTQNQTNKKKGGKTIQVQTWPARP
jgi:hypothetical protein